jgi:hypothetical protein
MNVPFGDVSFIFEGKRDIDVNFPKLHEGVGKKLLPVTRLTDPYFADTGTYFIGSLRKDLLNKDVVLTKKDKEDFKIFSKEEHSEGIFGFLQEGMKDYVPLSDSNNRTLLIFNQVMRVMKLNKLTFNEIVKIAWAHDKQIRELMLKTRITNNNKVANEFDRLHISLKRKGLGHWEIAALVNRRWSRSYFGAISGFFDNIDRDSILNISKETRMDFFDFSVKAVRPYMVLSLEITKGVVNRLENIGSKIINKGTTKQLIDDVDELANFVKKAEDKNRSERIKRGLRTLSLGVFMTIVSIGLSVIGVVLVNYFARKAKNKK